MSGTITAVCAGPKHGVRKPGQTRIRLLTGLGVEGDAHRGATVQHLSRKERNPNEPNLRQVHLIHAELHDELAAAGLPVGAGDMGENVTTHGVDLLGLPRGTRLRLGPDAVLEVTGLRNPCVQLEAIAPGLLAAVLSRSPDGELVRKAGIMGVVVADGELAPGDPVRVELPPEPHEPLDVV